MLKRDVRDIVGGGVVIAAGLFFVISSSEYTMGTAGRMGPGYLPTILGWILCFLGVCIALPAFFREGESIEIHWDSLAASLAALLIFSFLLNTLGMFFSTMIAVLLASLPKSLRIGVRLILATSIAIITVLIFSIGLQMQAPIFPSFLFLF